MVTTDFPAFAVSIADFAAFLHLPGQPRFLASSLPHAAPGHAKV
jgi:hypothetical protein